MQNGIEKYVSTQKINFIKIGCPIYVGLCIILTCITNHNFEFRKVKKENLVQYQFAEIINKRPQATLLNYGFLDGGFYTVTGITPNIKYFQKQNISDNKYPIMMKEQKRYIKEMIVDFVVIRVQKEEDSLQIPYLYENYDKVKSKYEEKVKNYYMLFERK